MPTFNFRLFGRFEAWRDRQDLTRLVTGKSRELLCYLLLHRHHAHPRETLAGVLWRATSGLQARRSLRKAVWQLRAALKCEEADSGQLLMADRDWISLELDKNVGLDVADFESILASPRWRGPHEITESKVQTLETAAKLYVGDLLEGWYQEWCIYERERLLNLYLYLCLLDTLVGYCGTQNRHHDAIGYGECILKHEQTHERTYQQLIRIYFAMGDRAGALRQYKRCCVALMQELGVAPSQETLAMLNTADPDATGAAVSTSTSSQQALAATVPNWSLVLRELDEVAIGLSRVRRMLRKGMS